MDLAFEKCHKCLHFILLDSFLVFGAPVFFLFLSGYFCQKHEVEIRGNLEQILLLLGKFCG